MSSTTTSVQDILEDKTLTFNQNATAAEFRQALLNDGTGSVVGAVVETSSAALTSGAALTGVTSITYKAQSDGEDLTGLTFDESVQPVNFDLDGHTGVLLKLAQATSKTITKTNNGTYFIKDTFTELNDGAAQTSGTASNNAEFKAIFAANEVQITDYAKTQDYARLDPTDSDVVSAFATANGGSGTPSLADVKVTIAADTTLSESEAATSNNITKVDLADGVSLTVTADAFDTSTNEWSKLTTLTGLSGTNNLVVTAGTSGATVDLFNINSLTTIDSVSIAGTTGADTINLSPSLTTDGITTIDLKSDTAADKIYFGVRN